ncbi:hypothetical protein L6164_013995 [Bauhinia variegata]|uniref:Uncharacterized protein n=1 Tax=Bauhinia variegata TaxID=167791 RepID=A0ACB9NJM6_BAUVA|nr:hypothetical protein L6164_013995 [Bauhinia variegata]
MSKWTHSFLMGQLPGGIQAEDEEQRILCLVFQVLTYHDTCGDNLARWQLSFLLIYDQNQKQYMRLRVDDKPVQAF